MGLYCLAVAYGSYTTSIVQDAGPNNGFYFVNTIADATTYQWTIAQDADTPSSAFYQAQCGNYNSSTNPNGFISGATLDTDLQRHEVGSVQGHYGNYVTALQNPSNNMGIQAERIVALSAQNLNSALQQTVTSVSQSVQAATAVEPCGSHNVNLNSSCASDGNINFAPYQACH